ncbi:MAG: polysaccharide biosynthesis/export family protein, partial [Candidatus Methylomirabilales bacterium]
MKRRERIYVFVMATTFLGVMAPLLVGCAVRGAMLNQQATAALESTETKNPAEYRIHPGDQMDIKFFFNPELNETVLVRP